jgi:hypothetical protein
VFLAAARRLGRAVGSIDEEGDVVGEKEREERARGLVFEDAFLGVMGGKRAEMSGASIHLSHPFVFSQRDFSFWGVVVWVPDENLLSVDSTQLTRNLTTFSALSKPLFRRNECWSVGITSHVRPCSSGKSSLWSSPSSDRRPERVP